MSAFLSDEENIILKLKHPDLFELNEELIRFEMNYTQYGFIKSKEFNKHPTARLDVNPIKFLDYSLYLVYRVVHNEPKHNYLLSLCNRVGWIHYKFKTEDEVLSILKDFENMEYVTSEYMEQYSEEYFT